MKSEFFDSGRAPAAPRSAPFRIRPGLDGRSRRRDRRSCSVRAGPADHGARHGRRDPGRRHRRHRHPPRASPRPRRSSAIPTPSWDAVTADDIGALPDKSVNEVLQRIPGVNINRFQGPTDPDHFSVEGSNVIISRPVLRPLRVQRPRRLQRQHRPRAWLQRRLARTAVQRSGGSRTPRPTASKAASPAWSICAPASPSTAANLSSPPRPRVPTAICAKKAGLGYSALVSNVWNTQHGTFGALLSYGESDLYSEAYGTPPDRLRLSPRPVERRGSPLCPARRPPCGPSSSTARARPWTARCNGNPTTAAPS